jgi:hypothetical protein
MRWDRHSLMAFGGIAVLMAGAAMLLAEASAAFAPVIGMVAGIAAMALANHERLKQRIEALERRLEQAEGRGGISRPGVDYDAVIDGADGDWCDRLVSPARDFLIFGNLPSSGESEPAPALADGDHCREMAGKVRELARWHRQLGGS